LLVGLAEGTNWSDAEGAQRVYEYAVEPAVLQSLPEDALLLVRRSGMQAVECDPALVTLPGVSAMPLVPAEAVRPAEAIEPPAPVAATGYEQRDAEQAPWREIARPPDQRR
jgi:hypothetical protein